MKISQEQLKTKWDELLQREQQFENEKTREAERQCALFPSFFRKGGALNGWLDDARRAERNLDIPAIRLLGKLREFQALCHPPLGEPDLQQVALALHELSREAHRFWKGQDNEFIDTAIAWRDAFNEALREIKMPLQVQAIFPKDRFDANVMVPAEVYADNRLYVKAPLSWPVIDISKPEHSKILHYGEVETV